MIVGIANPDKGLTREDAGHPDRAKSESNPFTYYERLLMIRETFLELGIKRTDFEIVPSPINYPELLYSYIPPDVINFTRIYEEWNKRKIQLLEEHGYQVKVLEEASVDKRLMSCSCRLLGEVIPA